ncbi:MAG: DciA family protein [Pseudomonadota bacterium]
MSEILGNSGIVNLSKQVEEYERLRVAIQSALPPMLKSSVHTSPLHQGVLILRCTNGTVHLKLRALAGQITDAVRNAGFRVEQIRVKVEPRSTPVVSTPRRVHRKIPAAGRVALERARQQCEGTGLAEAIEQLLKQSYGN